MSVKIHKKEDFDYMRRAGDLAAKTLDYITQFVNIGITTDELNNLCHDFIVLNGGIPAPLHYRGYPKSICVSINHVVCHGIPNDRKLEDGDILNIDVTVILDGWHGDSSRMYFAGKPSIKAKLLVDVTYDCMMAGIEAARPGNTLGDIGYAIQNLAEKNNFSVVRDYAGHGIGRVFHDEPSILHYGKRGSGLALKPGMFFTIEPMINAGKYETILSKIDGWTVKTRDRSLSAQFEHTVGITETGCEIFTLSRVGNHKPPYGKKNCKE